MATTRTNSSRLHFVAIMHRECLRNHATPLQRSVLDGCVLFEPKGPNGSSDFMRCAACGCHRNFHRRVEVDLPWPASALAGDITDLVPQVQAPQQNPAQRAPEPKNANPPPRVPQIHRAANRQAEEAGPAGGRRRLTGEQKERLREIVENKDWKMFKEYSPEEVAQVCAEVGIPRLCLKNWISILRRKQEARLGNANQV